jgi:hypothetical protein
MPMLSYMKALKQQTIQPMDGFLLFLCVLRVLCG